MRKQKGVACCCGLRLTKVNLPWSLVLVVIMVASAIMVMIIPIAVGVPAVAVFVPPPVCVRPAVFARFVQLLARIYHLSALPSVMLRGFV